MRDVKKIILHCSDTPDSDNSWNVERLRALHVQERGWKDIGYHYIVTKSGEWQKGRPVEEVGSHCLNHNADSIGVCWVGRSVLLDCQLETLGIQLRDLMATYGLSAFDVYGHHDFTDERTCPNQNTNLIRCFLLADFDIVNANKKE